MIAAELADGPLAGRSLDVEAVEGHPPKTIDVDASDGATCRYCPRGLDPDRRSAAYTFLSPGVAG